MIQDTCSCSLSQKLRATRLCWPFPIHFLLLVFVFIGKPSIDKTLPIFEIVYTVSMEHDSACVLATLQKTPQTIQGPGHQDSDCYPDHKKWRHVECHPAH